MRHRCKKCSDIKVASVGRGEIANLKACHFSYLLSELQARMSRGCKFCNDLVLILITFRRKSTLSPVTATNTLLIRKCRMDHNCSSEFKNKKSMEDIIMSSTEVV